MNFGDYHRVRTCIIGAGVQGKVKTRQDTLQYIVLVIARNIG